MGFIDRTGVGVDEGDAVAVGEGGVIDLDVVADDRLQQGGDGRVVLENDGDEVAGLRGAGRLATVGRHFGFQRLARGVQNLVGDELGVFVAQIDALVEDLGDVNVGESGDQGEDQSADCQHQLGF